MTCWLGFRAFDTIADGVFVECYGEIDVVDVGQRAEPGHDVGEFFDEIFAIAFAACLVSEGGGEFADFFHEPEEGAGRAACGVGGVILVADEFLELADGEIGRCCGFRAVFVHRRTV